MIRMCEHSGVSSLDCATYDSTLFSDNFRCSMGRFEVLDEEQWQAAVSIMPLLLNIPAADTCMLGNELSSVVRGERLSA